LDFDFDDNSEVFAVLTVFPVPLVFPLLKSWVPVGSENYQILATPYPLKPTTDFDWTENHKGDINGA
jgi:hypothetical protein